MNKKKLTIRNQLKKSFLENISEAEALELGISLGAGASHFRAFVGPPHLYDLVGALQFTLLIDLGLREYNSILEIGCGSLRLGRQLIPFLMKGRYFGIEPEEWLVKDGVKNHFGFDSLDNKLFSLKTPHFAYNNQFNFSITKGPVDFIIAQSIASHTGVKETNELIESIANIMHDDSVAIVTFIRNNNLEQQNRKNGWFYPECVTYTDNFFAEIAKSHNLFAAVSQWPMSNRREFGQITGQTPLILTKKPWSPSDAQRFAGLSIESAIKRL